jgi:hypothetical protein
MQLLNDLSKLYALLITPIDPSIYMHDCGFHKSRDLESFIILNFVVLYYKCIQIVFFVVTMFEYLVIHCLHLNHNTLNSVRKKVGSGKLG